MSDENFLREFLCDVILRQFCMSSYSRPPCWFPHIDGVIGDVQGLMCFEIPATFHDVENKAIGKCSGSFKHIKRPLLRVRAFFHKTVWVCHVYCNFKIGFTCRITVIFGTLKDGSLLINTLA